MILKATHLYKAFLSPVKTEILKGVSLEAQRGQTLSIMGASGAGKSTLLHILGTLEEPDQGEVFIEGIKADPSCRNQKIGFIFQGFYLIENGTVFYNLLLPARIGRRPVQKGSFAYTRAEMLLSQVGLSHRRDFLARDLSGGEKQRLSIARALMNNPSLILADEPTGNLDSENAERIQSLLIDAVKKENKTLMLATHDPDFAQKCDSLFILSKGILRSNF